MRPARTTFRTAARRLAALALGLWLSGAGCLACGERTGAHAAAEQVAQALVAAGAQAEEAAPAASSEHSCCTARVGSRARKGSRGKAATNKAPRGDAAKNLRGRAAPAGQRAAREQTAPRHPCCRRALRVSEQAHKAHADQPPAHAPSAAPRPARAAAAETFLLARPRAPDRAGTYLRCRVLLI